MSTDAVVQVYPGLSGFIQVLDNATFEIKQFASDSIETVIYTNISTIIHIEKRVYGTHTEKRKMVCCDMCVCRLLGKAWITWINGPADTVIQFFSAWIIRRLLLFNAWITVSGGTTPCR